jgi:predicted nucleic acid-binding protein
MDAGVADIETWLSAPNVHVIHPGEKHPHALRALTPRGSDGDFVNDVHLAALAWEHGGTVYSADQDFHRIPQVKWINPLQ